MARPANPAKGKPLSEKEKKSLRAQFPKDEDLVVVARDHKVYWVAKAEYKKRRFDIEEGDLYDHLLRAGVVLAQLPPRREDLPPVLGDARCICYLVNLASLHAQEEQAKVIRKKPPLLSAARKSPAAKKSSRTPGNKP